jgi:hypothetical protein
MTVRKIPLSLIRADESAQPRAAISEELVNEYAQDMKRGDVFPPLVVFCESVIGTAPIYWLSRGFHRFEARKRLGAKQVECDLRKGVLRDAILHSCGANAAHGLRRSSADKRNAVTKLIEDEEWSKWSDREIAKRCCVGPDLVADVRKELKVSLSESDSEMLQETARNEHRTYRNKHGTTAKMKTGKIGKSKTSPRHIPQRSQAAREAERQVAKTTTDAVASVFEARRAMDMTPDSPPPLPPFVPTPQPAPAKPNEFERHEEHGALRSFAVFAAHTIALVNSGHLKVSSGYPDVVQAWTHEMRLLQRSPLLMKLIGRKGDTDKATDKPVAESETHASADNGGETPSDADAPAGEFPRAASLNSGDAMGAPAAPTVLADEFSRASPMQDAPGDDDGLDIPESFRREPKVAERERGQ